MRTKLSQLIAVDVYLTKFNEDAERSSIYALAVGIYVAKISVEIGDKSIWISYLVWLNFNTKS